MACDLRGPVNHANTDTWNKCDEPPLGYEHPPQSCSQLFYKKDFFL